MSDIRSRCAMLEKELLRDGQPLAEVSDVPAGWPEGPDRELTPEEWQLAMAMGAIDDRDAWMTFIAGIASIAR